MGVLSALLLVTALSIDAFVASFAYGANRIRIPTLSVVTINAVCTGILTLSLLAGTAVRPYLPARAAAVVCFALLFLLGVVKLFDSTIKACIRRQKNLSRKIKFSLFHLRFILNVYADPEDADQDLSHTLSPPEAASLALALSLDGLTAGFGAALTAVSLPQVVLLSFLTGTAAVVGGGLLGNRMAKRLSFDISWLSGALLIVLAFLKL